MSQKIAFANESINNFIAAESSGLWSDKRDVKFLNAYRHGHILFGEIILKALHCKGSPIWISKEGVDTEQQIGLIRFTCLLLRTDRPVTVL